jgi:hypothetical protein
MGKKRRTRNEKRRGIRAGQPIGGRRWSSVQVFEGPEPGPDVVSASIDEVMAAIESVPQGLEWADLADQVIPVFQRVRPYPPGMPEPLRVVVPPGLSIGFGVDIGPAFLGVHADMLDGWPVTAAGLLERALANLARRMAAVSRDELIDGSVADVPIRALQSSAGCASTYVLLPELLGRIFGTEPQLLIAPMRNLLVSMPLATDREFAAWLFDEFSAQDPNGLAPAAFVIRDRMLEVEPLGDAYGRA